MIPYMYIFPRSVQTGTERFFMGVKHMKQTISILTALIAVLLLATGFIVASNLELSRNLRSSENQLLQTQSDLADAKAEAERLTQEAAASADALLQAAQERDALNQQLSAAVLSSQQASEAMDQQMLENQNILRELETLEAEYSDLTGACAALEMQIQTLSEQAVQTAAAYQQQSLADAQHIAALEAALSASPAPSPTPAPAAPIRRPALDCEY